ncbi:PhoH family protein [Micrococcoides hystricis]|uniref:PhoH family protein n=1 Tax=Micrococcoides hystricis TaxID=1572761 RepID=A0ABV6PA65_9MICC
MSTSAPEYAQAGSSTDRLATSVKSYVLDTSVLLADPKALFRFAEHQVIIPIVVISELEKKRHDPELGYFARQALRLLDELRSEHGDLSRPIPLEKSSAGQGTLMVELNHISLDVLPLGFRSQDNDTRILAVSHNLAQEGKDIVLVTKDVPLRVKAAALGLAAEAYRHELVPDTGYTGCTKIMVSDEAKDELYRNGGMDATELRSGNRPLIVNEGVVVHSPSGGSALARCVNGVSGKELRLVREQDVFGVQGRSAEQRLAIDLLLDDSVGIVSLGGRAGTGKSALALCAGLEAVMERRLHRKITVFRPLYAVGGQELGYLPGTEEEKMNPWGQAVYDTLGALVSENVLDEVTDRGLLEVLPLTHIRGRSLHDSYVIVDEAQSLEKNVLLTVLSRIGQNSKVVLTHDVAQRDNLRVGRHDGITAVVETLKGQGLFGHMTLQRSERSAIAALVTELLDEF